MKPKVVAFDWYTFFGFSSSATVSVPKKAHPSYSPAGS